MWMAAGSPAFSNFWSFRPCLQRNTHFYELNGHGLRFHTFFGQNPVRQQCIEAPWQCELEEASSSDKLRKA